MNPKPMIPALLALALAVSPAMAASPAGAAKPASAAPVAPIDQQPPGTVPWQLLHQAKTVQKPDRKFGPAFTREIRELDKQDVKLYGFMMPLEQSARQKRFLLTSFPPHCSFCLPGGPESMVEVIADKPIDFTYEPVVISGRMSVLDNDVVYFRLTRAKAVQP